MSIAIIAYTVVTMRRELEAKYPGGLEEYAEQPFVWFDDYIVGSSYMNLLDVESHLKHLSKYSIGADENGSDEVAVVCQRDGTNVDWLEFAKQDGNSIAWLKGQTPGKVVFPKEICQ